MAGCAGASGYGGRKVSGRIQNRHNVRDKNEPAILKELAKLGVVWVEAPPLDGWAVITGRFIPVEIKNPDGLNKLRPSQKRFIDQCHTLGLPYLVWRTVDDAVNDVNELRRKKILNSLRQIGLMGPP